MKIYHYVPKGSKVLEEGILSFAKNPNAELGYYKKRANAKTHLEIVNWMEESFKGRSKSVRVLTEPVQWHDESLSLKEFIQNSDLLSIDILSLEKDGLLEDIYYSPPADINTVEENYNGDEILIKLEDINDIDLSSIDWSVCNDEKGRRFYFLPYYLIVLKNGIIPPTYLTHIENY